MDINSQIMTTDDADLPLAHDDFVAIAEAEAATGVNRELLRMWERRYDFPKPMRDARGERLYSLEQIDKLRLIRQLQASGLRPGKLVGKSVTELEELLMRRAPQGASYASDVKTSLMQALKSDDPDMLRTMLARRLLKEGLEGFVMNFMPCANFIVGDEWQKGNVEIHEEHLYTEQVQSVLSVAMTGLMPPHPGAPRIMVCTASREPHTLGLTMVEALLRLERLNVISFGPEMPVRSVIKAAQKHQVNVVALSFSASYPCTKLTDYLEDLRFRLPSTVRIWVGGAATQLARRHVDGVEYLCDLGALLGKARALNRIAESRGLAMRVA